MEAGAVRVGVDRDRAAGCQHASTHGREPDTAPREALRRDRPLRLAAGEHHDVAEPRAPETGASDTGTLAAEASMMQRWIGRALVALAVAGVACAPGPSTAVRPTSGDPGAAPCVDAGSDAKRRLKAAEVSLASKLDLDGDGAPDPIVTSDGWCGSGGCDHLLYVQRGACARYVGRLRGREIRLAKGRHNGFADLETDEHGGAQWAEKRASLHADGEYHVDEERVCKARVVEKDEPNPAADCKPWGPPGG